MPPSTLASVPDEELLAAVRAGGNNVAAGLILGVTEQSIRRALRSRGLKVTPERHGRSQPTPFAEPASFTIKGDTATLITEVSPEHLGDLDALIRSRGLKPEEWIVLHATVNEWSAMRGSKHDNEIVPMRQLKVVLKRRASVVLLSPAPDITPVKRTARPKRKAGEPEYVLVESDHQAPYHDPRLHDASVRLIERLQPDEHIYIGDLMDFPTISRHKDSPATTKTTPQDCINAGFAILKEKRLASPMTRTMKLRGNHDDRIDSEQLVRSERLYDICPAEEEIPALDLRRLLHLDRLDIEFITDPRGWEHAEIPIVPGPYGLVARHGWMTGFNTAERSMKRRGRSLIVGHTHRRESAFWWDPSLELERVAATVGCMCLVRDQRHPHYVVCDQWLQGCAIVTRWPDGTFVIEHVRWDGNTLIWRNERF